MKYKRFVIKKYKAVKDAEIKFKNSLIPIIGINESGKTSILQAILAFDHDCDNIQNGAHLDARNRYEYGSVDHIIAAEVVFDNKQEKESLLSKLSGKKSSKKYMVLNEFFKVKNPIYIERNIDTRKYDIPELDADLETKQEVVSKILKITPFLLYFDDFTDRVPDRIVFPNSYFTNTAAEETFKPDEWNLFIEEIFYRATDRKVPLNKFIKIVNKEERDGVLDDVTDKLDEDIIKNWQKLKVLKQSLKSEIGGLTLKLDYDHDANKGIHVFAFKVIDKNFKDKKRHFNIRERSKGFQWFFNFAIKLKYNIKYTSEFENAIYLLDEPGSYLHSSAQSELLNSLKLISKTNKVIFCTHSEHLLVPDIINISSIKIASRVGSSVLLQNFGDYNQTTRSSGALDPVYHALHLNAGTVLNFKENDILITEGITDFYLFEMILKNISKYNNTSITILPGAGATNLKDLISYSIAWSNKYSLLLDSDAEGLSAHETYNEYFGDEEAKKWLFVNTPDKSSNIAIESLLSDNDQTILMNLVGSNNCKKGFISLYYSSKAKQKDFFKNIDEITTKNIHHMMDSIIAKLS
ncbi:MAG: AAA family ATPase [Leptospirales bacterium]